METIVITIPWVAVVLFALLAVSIVTFLIALLLWVRSNRRPSEEEPAMAPEPERAEPQAACHCPQCGAETQPAFRFCVSCGNAVNG